jgi:hypothetical protein
LLEEFSDGFRSVSKFPAPGALSRARALLLELGPAAPAMPFEEWTSLATICETAWFAAMARITRRRLRLLTSQPLSFAAFTAMRSGEGPLHLRGTAGTLPGHPNGALWRVEVRDDVDAGRALIEEAHDFVLSLDDGGYVYVVATGGHLASNASLQPGDDVSVFGFADEVPDRAGLASSVHGRGGLLPAIRSGSELPLLVTRNKVVR